ncbi:pleckstrin homology domain-containing family B member 2-like [Mizuhopecten yessoensis]|uniref:Pleckstrin homology domain-containing family B member 2 n=1 Tax=Mizuhopecten yessoensis TaxID=6573 RepID=A0A210PXB1_MIZYE|nr:pleckstrin homology domain-containing family B member 2-like [Mizuhopecten yessoensis]OWF41102.1 Pleckstrin homology domain-containing family B member 2 [Mizuhopecten yessoensis]
MTLSLDDNDVVILKQGWIYRQKTFFRKWKKSWLVICLGGSLKYYKGKQTPRPQKTFNIKNDCMTIRTGKKCRHLLPPNNVDTEFLIEIILTGERSLKFCAHDQDSFKMWLHALQRAQSDRALPTPRYERRNLRPEEIDEFEERGCWYACFRKNKVETL